MLQCLTMSPHSKKVVHSILGPFGVCMFSQILLDSLHVFYVSWVLSIFSLFLLDSLHLSNISGSFSPCSPACLLSSVKWTLQVGELRVAASSFTPKSSSYTVRVCVRVFIKWPLVQGATLPNPVTVGGRAITEWQLAKGFSPWSNSQGALSFDAEWQDCKPL